MSMKNSDAIYPRKKTNKPVCRRRPQGLLRATGAGCLFHLPGNIRRMMTTRKHSTPARSRRAPRRQRQTPAPDQGDARWLYGVHAVLAALANPNRRCHRLLLAPDTARRLGARLAGLTSPDRPLGALGALGAGGAGGEITSRAEIARFLPAGAVHQGLALETEPLPGADLETACRPTPEGANRVVVLDGVTDPQNVGAIMRSAAAFGVRAIVLTRRHAPPVTGALAKAASGALESVALVRVNNLARSLDALADLGYWRLGLDVGAATALAPITCSFTEHAKPFWRIRRSSVSRSWVLVRVFGVNRLRFAVFR